MGLSFQASEYHPKLTIFCKQLHRSKDDLTYDTQPLSSPWLRVAGRPIKGLLSYTPEINERIWKARAEIEAQEDGEERLPVVFCGCDSISQTGGLVCHRKFWCDGRTFLTGLD